MRVLYLSLIFVLIIIRSGESKDHDGNLEIKSVLKKQNFCVHEPIIVEIEITNRSQENIFLHFSGSSTIPSEVRVESKVATKSNPSPYISPGLITQRVREKVIKSGGSYTFSLILNQYFSIEDPGKYTFSTHLFVDGMEYKGLDSILDRKPDASSDFEITMEEKVFSDQNKKSILDIYPEEDMQKMTDNELRYACDIFLAIKSLDATSKLAICAKRLHDTTNMILMSVEPYINSAPCQRDYIVDISQKRQSSVVDLNALYILKNSEKGVLDSEYIMLLESAIKIEPIYQFMIDNENTERVHFLLSRLLENSSEKIRDFAHDKLKLNWIQDDMQESE